MPLDCQQFQKGLYRFLNDKPEQERGDMKHAMIVHLYQGKENS
jgi:hypothetical protein